MRIRSYNKSDMMILISLIVIHVLSQNFSFVQLSDIHCGEKPEVLGYLTAAVNKINGLIDDNDIKFALFTGDLSHHGNTTEMIQAKVVLDKLEIPYYPTIGNHDIYGLNEEKNRGTGDFRFQKLVSHIFEDDELVSHYSGTIGVKNPRTITPSYFQNFQLDYNGLRILVMDYNSRVPHMFYPHRSAPGADLMNFPGGTWEWMSERLSANFSDVTTLLFALHQPFYNPIYIPKFYEFCWTDKDKKVWSEYLSKLTEDLKNKIYGDLSGHLHKFEDRTPFHDSFEEHAINAIKNGPIFILVKVVDGKISDITRFE